MTANASLILDKRDGVLLAPNWAIRKDRATRKAYLTLKVDDKTTREIEVKTGLRNDNFSEIVSGATEGQVVVAPQASSLLGK
jgi:HlyD family secretion protein